MATRRVWQPVLANTLQYSCLENSLSDREAWQATVFSLVQFSSVAQLCPTLCDPVDCGLPGFIVTGALQARITVCIGQYWLPLFWSTIFPAALAANSPEYLVLPEPLQPKQLHHLHTWPSLGQTHSSRETAGANPSGQPTCSGGNKTTIETQRWYL